MAVDYVRDTMGRTTEVGVTPSGSTRQVLIREATVVLADARSQPLVIRGMALGRQGSQRQIDRVQRRRMG
ncbi:hypothetical protein [Montanilutibacter psychrotolerans]|nr:hypothetical protein [Lysobacter psychrotolerans]